MRRTSFAATLAALLLAAGCGDSGRPPEAASRPTADEFNTPFADAEAYPVFVNSEIVVGPNRFLVGLLDSTDAPVASPKIDMHIAFFDLTRSRTEPAFERDMRFLWTIKPVRGLYVTNVSFPSPGRWGAEVTVSGEAIDETVKAGFEVAEEGTTPALGERVPASDTPTLDDVKDVSTITTDPHPDRRFYRKSIADALEADEPFVVVFATPKFCTSQVCGPTLDVVKEVAKRFSNLTFIHVEVYDNLDDPANLRPVESVKEWGLPSEPWVFVVDSSGRVAAKYEGAVAPGELRDALRKL